MVKTDGRPDQVSGSPLILPCSLGSTNEDRVAGLVNIGAAGARSGKKRQSRGTSWGRGRGVVGRTESPHPFSRACVRACVRACARSLSAIGVAKLEGGYKE